MCSHKFSISKFEEFFKWRQTLDGEKSSKKTTCEVCYYFVMVFGRNWIIDDGEKKDDEDLFRWWYKSVLEIQLLVHPKGIECGKRIKKRENGKWQKRIILKMVSNGSVVDFDFIPDYRWIQILPGTKIHHRRCQIDRKMHLSFLSGTFDQLWLLPYGQESSIWIGLHSSGHFWKWFHHNLYHKAQRSSATYPLVILYLWLITKRWNPEKCSNIRFTIDPQLIRFKNEEKEKRKKEERKKEERNWILTLKQTFPLFSLSMVRKTCCA